MHTAKRALVLIGLLLTLIPLAVLFAQEDTDESTVTAQAFRPVNVRSGPSTRFPVIAQLREGDVVAVLGRSDVESNWLLIEVDGGEGWVAYFAVSVTGDPDDLEVIETELEAVPAPAVAAALVVEATPEASVAALEPSATAEPESAPTTLFNANLRAVPEYSGDILLTIPFNTAIEPDGRTANSNWLHVTFDGQTGWVIASLVDMDADEIGQLPVIEG